MPSISLDKKKVLHYLGKKVNDETLRDRIAMLGTDLESITEDEINVEVFPNRPDMLSEEGFARSLASFLGIRRGLTKYKIHKSKYESNLEKEAIRIRPYVGNAVVKGIKMNDYTIKSLMNMQEKLHGTQCRDRKKASIGVYDLDTIKFPLNYIAVDKDFSFTPLFSEKKMTVKEILEKHPKGKDYAHLLPGPKYTVWIDSNEKVLSLPPIINSIDTAVTEKTKNLFVDVTGTHKRTVSETLNIVVSQLAEMGGEIYEIKVNGEPCPNLDPKSMVLKVNYVNKMLGLDLKPDKMATFLHKMGHGAEVHKNSLIVNVPAYRVDILHPIDLVEDVAIAYGYENFREEIPKVSTIGEESKDEIVIRKLANICAGFSLIEVYNYHLTNCNDLFKKMRCQKDNIMELLNSKNENYDVIRNTLLPGLMKILSENKHHEYPQIIFEIGRIVRPNANAENGAVEDINLSIALCHNNADFSSIKSHIKSIVREAGKTVSFKEGKNPSFIEGRCARIFINEREAGIMGEIHPKVLNNFDIELPVAALEINTEKLRD